MNETDFKKLLDRYLKGNCTPAEQEQLEQWFDQLSEEGETRETDTTAVMERLKGNIDRQIGPRHFFRWPVVLRIAASVIVILSAGIWTYFQYHRADSIHYITTTTGRGQHLKLTLPDGSVVNLNAGSSIRYPENFRKHRTVALLEGEACFDVAAMKAHPFTVTAAGTQTEVLGTTFNVQAYKVWNEVTVTVVRGKVAVKTPAASPVLLLPDEQVQVSTVTGMARKQPLPADAAIGWMNGKLQFRNESLQHVAWMLENNYDVKIMFKEEATKEIRFTAGFSATDSLEKILFAIAKANKIKYSVRDKVVVLF
jgi:ferric-dicitrate binding protein FerR (iron transport regulator)